MVELYRHQVIVGQARVSTPGDQRICLFRASAFDQNVGGFRVSSKVGVKLEGWTYSLDLCGGESFERRFCVKPVNDLHLRPEPAAWRDERVVYNAPSPGRMNEAWSGYSPLCGKSESGAKIHRVRARSRETTDRRAADLTLDDRIYQGEPVGPVASRSPSAERALNIFFLPTTAYAVPQINYAYALGSCVDHYSRQPLKSPS
jgi:hypothetical protein